MDRLEGAQADYVNTVVTLYHQCLILEGSLDSTFTPSRHGVCHSTSLCLWYGPSALFPPHFLQHQAHALAQVRTNFVSASVHHLHGSGAPAMISRTCRSSSTTLQGQQYDSTRWDSGRADSASQSVDAVSRGTAVMTRSTAPTAATGTATAATATAIHRQMVLGQRPRRMAETKEQIRNRNEDESTWRDAGRPTKKRPSKIHFQREDEIRSTRRRPC